MVHYLLEAETRCTENLNLDFFLSLVIMQSVTADGSLRSPTGGVEELYPTPHIHEQMTAYIMATTTSTLSQTR